MNNLDFEIRNFEEKDIDELFTIETLCFATPWTKEALLQEFKNKFAKYLVATKDKMIIGYVGVWLILDEGHITNIAVHPEFRGIGVGNALLFSIIDFCKNEGISAMTLEVRKSNLIAQNLYEKYGFTLEGIRKGYYGDNNEDALIMWNRNI